MKSCILGLSLFFGVGSVSAGDQFAPGPLPGAVVQRDATLAVPPGVELRHIFRVYRQRANTRVTMHYWPERWEDIGYAVEGTIGFVSAVPFENSVLIRSCFGPSEWNYFTSSDPKCEAENGGVWGPGDWEIGYISTVHLPGTTPMYRCVFQWRGKWRHFDSLDLNCEGVEGVRNDGPLGYIFL
jgi:hypothetical protein